MVRFIHTADIHLDSPLKGLEKYEGAPVEEIRGATRRALENLVALAIRREVDFVLIAGDLYDGDWRDHNTGLYFVGQMNQLREAGIPVVIISGNHDAANRMTRSLRLPGNVELLGSERPTTAKSDELAAVGVAVHGQSFGKPAEFENLALGYPRRQSGLFNIGLLHTSLDGAEGHEPYAPCAVDHLRQKEYDYWALGHVHSRHVCSEGPPVVFPGNVQGRHIREAGAKGCYVVTADERRECELEFVPLDVFRWEVVAVDATDAESPDCIVGQFAMELGRLGHDHDNMPLAVRVQVTGATDVHKSLWADPSHWTNELRAVAQANTSRRIWVEKVKWLTTSRQERIDASDRSGPIGTLLSCLEELRGDQRGLTELAKGLGDLHRKLPDEVTRGDDALRIGDPDKLRQWLDEVEPLLLNRLRKGGGG